MNQVLKENIKIAIASIRGNLLRTVITAAIIAIGITALVGILTAIDVFKSVVNENFAQMGSNTFTVQNSGPMVRIGSSGTKPKRHPIININQALEFKEVFDFAAITSVSFIGSGAAELKSAKAETDPNIQVWGGDENYLPTAGYDLSAGRNFSLEEAQAAQPYMIIGSEVKELLFPDGPAIGNWVQIRGEKFKVIGELASKGTAMGFGGDKVVIIPILTARRIYARPNQSFSLNVMVTNPSLMDAAIGEATAAMRRVRRLKPENEDNFNITKSDNIAQLLIGITSQAGLAVTVIGFITLLSSAISLMNIMLVSVTERTREIGIRKAMGATAATIRKQFLIEALLICQLGGIAGVVLGVTIGNSMALILGGGFIMPWMWIFIGLIVCVAVGLLSGFYPASKASKLDPIESLRYE